VLRGACVRGGSSSLSLLPSGTTADEVAFLLLPFEFCVSARGIGTLTALSVLLEGFMRSIQSFKSIIAD
jgi:hypothetical protein